MMFEDECVFCRISAGIAPAQIIRIWDDAVAFTPLNPCTPGHTLVIPRVHVASAQANPAVTGAVFRRAAELLGSDANLITNSGLLAGQTVFHLHVHIVPRVAGDGLLLPWSHQV